MTMAMIATLENARIAVKILFLASGSPLAFVPLLLNCFDFPTNIIEFSHLGPPILSLLQRRVVAILVGGKLIMDIVVGKSTTTAETTSYYIRGFRSHKGGAWCDGS